MKLQTDLREFIELLNSHCVDYLVVGGYAVAFHGHPRFTGDIDVFVRSQLTNTERVMAALRDFGFDNLSIDAAGLASEPRILQLGTPPNRVDILTAISGVDFDAAWSGRVDGELDGLHVYFIGRDHLMQNKRASGRDKDLLDLRKLERVGGDAKSD